MPRKTTDQNNEDNKKRNDRLTKGDRSAHDHEEHPRNLENVSTAGAQVTPDDKPESSMQSEKLKRERKKQ